MRIGGLLVDLDGTLYVGDEPVRGAREAVSRLRDAGLALRFVTNTTRAPRREIVARLRGMGFEAREEHVFTPAVAAAARLRGRRVHALVAEGLSEDLGGVDLTDDEPECVLIGDLGRGFDYARLNAAFRYLMGGADLVALQKNRYWHETGGLSLDAGAFVAALEYASGKEAAVVGKPEAPFFEAVLREMGLDATGAAMVGDDAEADVAGAKRAGLRGVLVKTGKYRAGAEGGADLVVHSFAELPEALGM